MYLEFYNLNEYPFAITCDERFFYESAVHAEALANMVYTAEQRKGMVLVTGEVGAGKTFVGAMLAARLGAGCLTVMVRNPPTSAKQLVRAVASGIGMNVRPGSDKLELIDELEQHLIGVQRRGRLVVLVIDECQDLPAASLEEIRLLWNWEQDGRRLVQIVLIGQPELRHRLMEPKWEALRQRVVLSYHLRPLSRGDTEAYVHHRIAVASNGNACLVGFSGEALEDIHRATDGIPRLINILCDNALLVGYAKGLHRIDRTIVNEVLRNMTCWGLRASEDRVPEQTGSHGPVGVPNG